MSEPLRDTETIRAVKLEALAKITEMLLSGGYDGSEGHMGSPDTTFTDFGEVCGIAEWLVGRLQAAEEQLQANRYEYQDNLAASFRERDELQGRLQAAEQERDDARAALSVSPAPTLTERGSAKPPLASGSSPDGDAVPPRSVSAASPAPQERP